MTTQSLLEDARQRVLALDAREAWDKAPQDYDRTSWIVGYMAAVTHASMVLKRLDDKAASLLRPPGA